MIRADIITLVGRDFLESNIENDEFIFILPVPIKRSVFTPIPTEHKLVVSYPLFTTGRNHSIPVFLKVSL